jgi:hypothetical protein
MRTRVWTTLLIIAVALALPAVSDARIVRNTAGGVETIQCRGESVEINGASGDLTLLVECPEVEVNGTGNTVRIELARDIEVNGLNNKVIWERSMRGRTPAIDNTGVGNTVQQGTVAGARRSRADAETSDDQSVTVSSGTGEKLTVDTKRKPGGESVTVAGAGEKLTVDTKHKAAGESVTVASGGESLTVNTKRKPGGESVTVESGGESVAVETNRRAGATSAAVGRSKASGSGRRESIVISDNGRTETIDCDGGSVSVDGNFNKLSLTGECQSVEVNGNSNVLRVQAAAAISTAGNFNTVTWSRGVGGRDPKLSNLGTGNKISRKAE